MLTKAAIQPAIREFDGCSSLLPGGTAIWGFAIGLRKPMQIPVTDSNHRRGMPSAAVMIPRLQKRSVSVDYLARLASLMRLDFWRDPVHFKLAA
jgi:hypothetical protein